MKTLITKALLAAVAAMSFSQAVALADTTTAYDNTANYSGYQTVFTNGEAVGNQIILDSANLYLNGFSLSYYSSGESFSETAQMDIQFYLNDGEAFNGYATPGTLIYDSGSFSVQNWGNVTLNFSENDLYTDALVPLTGALPTNQFTFVISFTGLNPSDQVGILMFTNPAVGWNYDDYWYNTGGGWSLMTNSVGVGSLGAVFTVPEPSTNGLIAVSAGLFALFGLAWRRKSAKRS